ncbi:MAG: class I SAM-dependent methyltransferase, partial [Nitrospirota bacterium]
GDKEKLIDNIQRNVTGLQHITFIRQNRPSHTRPIIGIIKRMTAITENILTETLLNNFTLRPVEPGIYSVLPDDESGSEYDTQFGFMYDLVACNPLYNRLIWGYSINIFPRIAGEALRFGMGGKVLDLGCGSLAFTAAIYSQYSGRPVVLVDQSLKMLRMGKSRLIKRAGKVPDNIVFLHADALNLPFRDEAFETVLSENLLHCLPDTNVLLKRLEKILTKTGKMYFTTLVKNNRIADKYLEALGGSGKLVSRTVDDHRKIFDQLNIHARYETQGNMVSVYCGR